MPVPLPPRRYLDAETLQRIGNLPFIAKGVVEGVRVGSHRSPLRGFSTEFAQHRPYVPGDELKHIDWRVYGRTRRYHLKQYQAETNFTAHLLLDASRSMQFASGRVSKLQYAKYMAAAFAYLIVSQRDSVGLAVFDDALREHVEPRGSLEVIHSIGTALDRASGRPRTDIAAILHEFARRLKRRGIVMLFSDLFDHVEQFLAGIEHLRFVGQQVIVFHVLDPHELTLPLRGAVRFRGLEGEPAVVTEPRRVRAAYLRELNAWLGRVRRACEHRRVDYMLVDTSRPVAAVLSSFLVGQQRVNVNRLRFAAST
jgi:uncharacterized protein (DUF58 family)